MVSVQDAILVIVGIIATFAGYSVFRDMMPLWAFILGGWLTYILLPTLAGPERASNLIITIVAVLIGGAIAALLSRILYFVIVFLSGAALGMLIGVVLGAIIDVGGFGSTHAISRLMTLSFPPIPQTSLQFILMVLAGLLMGALAVAFQQFMICASSAFVGAAALVSGLLGPINHIGAVNVSQGATMMVAWLILGMIGTFLQLRVLDTDPTV